MISGSYLSKNGYVIRKDSISPDLLSELKTELRGRPLQDEKYAFNKDTSFPLYIETKNKIYIPKIYAISKFGPPQNTMPSYFGKKWENDIPFTGTLYPIQVEATDILYSQLTTGNGGGILALQTGLGKSISALHILAKLKVKALIIVNKITLLKQWESEIRSFLPEARIGFLQGQKNVKVENTDIVIAMLQSMARIDYDKSLFEDFGCVCIDETHNVSSPVFSKVLMKICCKYTIGLSATPKRSDGCEYVFKWFLGDIVYRSNTQRSGLKPIIELVKLNSDSYTEVASENKATGKKQIMFSSMISELVSMPKRNELIINIIKNKILESRRILVLSERREHLKLLRQMLDNDTSVMFTYGLFIGQMKSIDLEKSKSSQVILATYQAFGEGVSEKDLDTLVLVTPKKFIGHLQNTCKNESGKLEQIVGRIFRKDHTEKHPMIIDIQDNFSIYRSQSMQRRVFYKNHFKDHTIKQTVINLDGNNKHSEEEKSENDDKDNPAILLLDD
jgi:superfamily II DNA or RNA helicase